MDTCTFISMLLNKIRQKKIRSSLTYIGSCNKNQSSSSKILKLNLIFLLKYPILHILQPTYLYICLYIQHKIPLSLYKPSWHNGNLKSLPTIFKQKRKEIWIYDLKNILILCKNWNKSSYGGFGRTFYAIYT